MDQTISESREMDLQLWRNKMSNALRDLADLLDATTRHEFPTPSIYCDVYTVEAPTDDDAYNTVPINYNHVRAAMLATPGKWEKYNTTNYVSYTKRIADVLRVRLEIARSTTCRRVQIGTEHVEATEAHDEPVYEWQCGEPEPEVTNG